MKLGEKLRMLRRNTNDLKLTDVAKETGLSVSFLSDLERGRTQPSIETLKKLSNFYKVSLNELLENIETGEKTTSRNLLPSSLQEFMDEEDIEPDMLDLMLTIEQRSKNQPASKDDWKKYYYSLKALLGQ